MSIGENIRFFRKSKGITQGKLAELSGIHPVSIRKYETNKMEPQLAQIKKISNALDVNTFAITGTFDSLKLETAGDLIGFLIVLYKVGFIIINGERNKYDLLKIDTITLSVNPLITKFFYSTTNNSNIDFQNILFSIKNENMLDDFLRWERSYLLYQKAKADYEKNPTKITKENCELAKRGVECIESALQQSNIPLNSDEPYTSHIFMRDTFIEWE